MKNKPTTQDSQTKRDKIKSHVTDMLKDSYEDMIKKVDKALIATIWYSPNHEKEKTEAEANAAYICEAVNNYSSLKEENERLKEALKQIADCRGLNLDSSDAKGFTIIAEKALKQ